jgi:hypothetical protein
VGGEPALKTRLVLTSILVACLLHAGTALAEASAQEKALASRLFDDASKLMAAGQAVSACPKYAESQRLDPQLGTLLHLGECYVKLGKTASAWASFKEAADIAAQRNDPRADKIRERLAALEKTLSNLVIVVADSEPATLEVRQDGALVGKAGWGTPIPVDPGEHKISATAPGAKAREVTTTVAGNGQTATVSLPPIEYLPTGAPAQASGSTPTATQSTPGATPAATPSEGASHRKLAALVVGGVGVVGLGVGAAFGLMVKPTYDKSAAHCTGNNCDATGHSDRQSAFSKAEVSNIAFGVGAAALLGGVVLWLTAPKEHATESATLITPLLGPRVALVSVQRSW